MNSPPRRGPEPTGAQSAQSAAAKEVVEQPSAAAATPRSPEPPEAPPETERIPATPVESCFDCLILVHFALFFSFFLCLVLAVFFLLSCSVVLLPIFVQQLWMLTSFFMLANLEPWNL